MAVIGSPTSHFQFEIPENSTSVRKNIHIALDTGLPATGFDLDEFTVSDAAEFSYFRDDAAAVVDAAFDGTSVLDTATTLGTWETQAIKEISATKMPGWYEISFPDAAFIQSANGKAQAQVVFAICPDAASNSQNVQVTFILTKVTPSASIQRHVRKSNSTSVRENVYFTDEQTGLGKTGLSKTSFTIADAAEFAFYRGDAAAAVDAKFDATTCLGDQTTLGTWVSATIKEISSTLMPGWYEVCFPNAMFIINQASGVKPQAVSCILKPELASGAGIVNVTFDLFRSVAR